MHETYRELEELCETVSEELKKANDKIRTSDGLSAGDVEYLDKLTHMLKSIKTTMAMIEPEGYSGRRDSRGRYSSRMYYDDGMIEELTALMHEAPDEKTKHEFKRFITKIQAMK